LFLVKGEMKLTTKGELEAIRDNAGEDMPCPKWAETILG